MFLLISLLLYQQTFTVDEKVFKLDAIYGFESGGNFNVKISNCHYDNLLFVIATRDDFNGYIDLNYIRNSCNLSLINYGYQIKIINGTGEIYGSIQENGVYESAIYACDYSNKDYQISIKYQNPNSLLSSHLFLYLQTYPKFIIVTGFLLSMWYNYLYCIKKYTNVQQNRLTGSFICFFIEKVFYYLLLKKTNDYDDIKDYIFYLIIVLIFKSCFTVTLFDNMLDFIQHYLTYNSVIFPKFMIDFGIYFLILAILLIYLDVNLQFVVFGFFCVAELILYLVYLRFFAPIEKMFHFHVKIQNHFLLISLIFVGVYDLFEKNELSYYCILIMDYITITILACFGLISLLIKVPLYNFVEVDVELS